jgi:hypothetical protein
MNVGRTTQNSAHGYAIANPEDTPILDRNTQLGWATHAGDSIDPKLISVC